MQPRAKYNEGNADQLQTQFKFQHDKKIPLHSYNGYTQFQLKKLRGQLNHSVFNPYSAKLFVSNIHSFKAGIANAIPASNDEKYQYLQEKDTFQIHKVE